MQSLNNIHLGATIIALLSLTILILWDKVPQLKKLKLVPGALVVVVLSVLLNELFIYFKSPLAILSSNHLVTIPSWDRIKSDFSVPDFSALTQYKVWVIALTIAVVASIETLLCIEATDKLDPLKRFTDTNQELKAQGIGNIISGILGGLPMTSVVVRSSANINSGGKTRLSAITHGILLLICVLAIPYWLNKIPLATLAAVLLLVGYKLAKPSFFIHMWQSGKVRFVPFIITVLGVVFIDLLKGVAIGLILSVIYILYENLKFAYTFDKNKFKQGNIITLKLAQEVSFLNKAAIKNTLFQIPENTTLHIDASQTRYIDFDVLEVIKDFKEVTAPDKNITLQTIGFQEKYNIENTIEGHINY